MPEGKSFPTDGDKAYEARDIPKDRSDFNYFTKQKDKVKTNLTRQALLKKLNIDGLKAFCCISFKLGSSSEFEIDHICSLAKIKENVASLLKYLNENAAFAKGFLGENTTDDFAVKIKRYFTKAQIGKDKKEEIKGTDFLYQALFNSIDNLFFIKPIVNREKSDKPPKEWVEDNFRDKPKTAIENAGGIQEGVVIDRIFSIAGTEQVIIDNRVIYLHRGKGEGIGELVINWLNNNAKEIIEWAGDIEGINEDLTSLLADNMEGKCDEALIDKTLTYVESAVKISNYFKENYASQEAGKRSKSRADSENSKESRTKIDHESRLEGVKVMHELKKIKDRAAKLLEDTEEGKENFNKKYYDDCFFDLIFLKLTGQKYAEALAEVARQLDEIEKSGKKISYEELKAIFKAAKDKVDPDVLLGKEREENAKQGQVVEKLTEKNANLTEKNAQQDQQIKQKDQEIDQLVNQYAQQAEELAQLRREKRERDEQEAAKAKKSKTEAEGVFTPLREAQATAASAASTAQPDHLAGTPLAFEPEKVSNSPKPDK